MCILILDHFTVDRIYGAYLSGTVYYLRRIYFVYGTLLSVFSRHQIKRQYRYKYVWHWLTISYNINIEKKITYVVFLLKL